MEGGIFQNSRLSPSRHPESLKTALRATTPSGVAEPSQADQMLTQALRQALGLVDVTVLNQFVVAAGQMAWSMAERE